MSEPILILGASTRAAAASALRAGLRPSTADLFCDHDLQQMVSSASRVEKYPADLPGIARGSGPGNWMFTGALENHPLVIDRICRERRLWGTPSAAVGKARNPWQLARRLRDSGLPYPRILSRSQAAASSPADLPGSWLCKPFRSAGGGNIHPWPGGDFDAADENTASTPRPIPASYYLQQAVSGESQSAVFVAARGAATLLGVTRQVIGADWTGASGFRYAGSIGPWPSSAAQSVAWRRIGECLAQSFDLQGLFGVDAIVNDGGVWTLEVNPRYTSSIEVLEYGLEFAALAAHVAACRDGLLPPSSPEPRGRFRGKAIIYASRDLWIDQALVAAASQANAGHAWPQIADIPRAEQTVLRGHPVATVFASSNRLDDVEPRLRSAVHRWRHGRL